MFEIIVAVAALVLIAFFAARIWKKRTQEETIFYSSDTQGPAGSGNGPVDTPVEKE